MNKKTVIAVICLFTVITPGLAEITTDGTVGPAAQLSGPQFQIGQELGSLRGNNLFHSFGRFNLNSSERATFTGNSHIQNVISRVTGGTLSNIDGALKSEIGQATFYFINPAGIVFGPNAQVDVPGAFYASTAGELKFSDGTRFSAINPQGNTLSMAAPETFGFLGKQTGALSVNGAELVFKPGAAVHLSAGKITMDKASLTGEGMDLRLVAVGNDEQEVGVASLPNQALSGVISINDTVLDASGNGKGRVAVRAGDVIATNSQIDANNNGNMDMPANQGIDIRVGGLTLQKNTRIASRASGIGAAGTIKVDVKKDLILIEGGRISARTTGLGDAGKIIVNAKNLYIDGDNSDNQTGINSITSSTNKGPDGDGGAINVNIQKSITILNTGVISSGTQGTKNGGTVNVNAQTIYISNTKNFPGYSTGINSNSVENSSGDAGKVNVNASKSLKLLNGGDISSSSFGEGDAGDVVVTAGNATINGEKFDNATGIFSSSDSNTSGNAGSLNLTVQNELILLNTGLIDSSTYGKGNGGSVNINAKTIRILKTIDSDFDTVISSSVLENSKGNPGSININATKLISMRGGSISISSGLLSDNTTKTNAKITITTPQLILSNDSIITSEAFGTLPAGPIEINTSRLSMDNSSITTAANQADGGPITIYANDWIQLKNSQITTSVSGDIQSFSGTNIGNGGDITINADVLVLDTGFIQANTNRKNASGGNINLNVKQLVASRGNLQSGSNAPLIFIPNSAINVIQAAAPDGINGTINNTAPQLNIVGALVGINTPQLDLNRVGRDPCSSTVQQSTMKKLGKGGIPFFNKGQDNYTIDRLLPNKQGRPSQTTDPSKALPNSHDCEPKTRHPQPQDATKQAG